MHSCFQIVCFSCHGLFLCFIFSWFAWPCLSYKRARWMWQTSCISQYCIYCNWIIIASMYRRFLYILHSKWLVQNYIKRIDFSTWRMLNAIKQFYKHFISGQLKTACFLFYIHCKMHFISIICLLELTILLDYKCRATLWYAILHKQWIQIITEM